MTDQFRPMLARAVEPDEKLLFPLIASPKLDGVRCLVIDGRPMSRSLKPLPNRKLAQILPWHLLNGLDGELVIGDPTAPDAYNRTTSAVMAHDGGLSGLRFWVFDDFTHEDEPYWVRANSAAERVTSETHGAGPIDLLTTYDCDGARLLAGLEEFMVARGYEGLMLRDPMAPYKCGRTSKKERGLLKLKRFEDSEAEILQVHPLMRNGNAQERNELGLAKRSTSQANLVPDSLLGALDVRDVKTGTEFSIGSGFDEATRRKMWADRDFLPGQLVKYKFQPAGVKEAPRFPVFQGMRDRIDL